MINLRNRLPVAELLLCAVIVAFAFVSPAFIPYNMDEFSHYHVLGCKYNPLSDLYNSFANGCREYDLRLPGTSTFLPLRSYIYIGVAQTFPFLPFWAFFRDPIAGRIQGAAYLILATYLLSRLVEVRWRHAMFAVLLFPTFCLPFIFDTGPVGISICILLLVLLLIRKASAIDRRGPQIGSGILIGLLIFLAISIKAVFFWVVPAVLLWGLWVFRPRDRSGWLAALRRRLPFLAAAALTCAAPLALLLDSVDRGGRPFAAVSASGGLSLNPISMLAQTYYLGRLVTNGTDFYLRVMSLPVFTVIDALPALIAILILAIGLSNSQQRGWRFRSYLLGLGTFTIAALIASRATLTPFHLFLTVLCAGAILVMLALRLLYKADADRQLAGMLFVLACLTFAIITANHSAWAPHHLVYAMVFVVAALAVGIGRFKAGRSLVAILVSLSVLYWLTIAVRLPHAVIHTDTDFDKDRLAQFIRTSHLDASTVQVHVDWGTYYISHTFGDKNQLVLTLYKFSAETTDKQRRDIRQIHAIASRLGRDILLITQEPSTLRQDPIIVDTLGRPAATYAFNTWTIARYHP